MMSFISAASVSVLKSTVAGVPLASEIGHQTRLPRKYPSGQELIFSKARRTG
jgi:hypothetical protein